MPGFIGFVQLESAIDNTVVAKNTSNVPTDADALPSYRIYGPAGFLSSGGLTFKDSGSITNAPPHNPTVYTSSGHDLSVGTKVTISGILGNTGANVTGDVTAVTSSTFTLAVDTSAGGAYTGGGTWHATGVYDFSFTPSVSTNYASGSIYTVYCFAKFSSTTTIVDVFNFQVT